MGSSFLQRRTLCAFSSFDVSLESCTHSVPRRVAGLVHRYERQSVSRVSTTVCSQYCDLFR
jgi:hypothetical protein